jgi:hypothetical protein
MNLDETVIEGTLTAGGVLQLDEKPNLLPGRVKVAIRPISQPIAAPEETWFTCLQQIRAGRVRSGYPFLNDREIEAFIESIREDDFVDDLLRGC